MCRAVLRRGLPEGAVHRTAGRMRRVLRHMVRVMLMRMPVRGVAVRDAGGVTRAEVRRTPMVLGQRERRARRAPVAALLHLRARASRRPAARAPPRARHCMPPRVVRAPIVALAPRHPSRGMGLCGALAARAHPNIRARRSHHSVFRYTSTHFEITSLQMALRW